MALAFDDRIKESSTTTGTGTYSLGGAFQGFQTFVAGIGTGNTTWYAVTDGTDWETGLGTVTSGAPDTLSRDEIFASSNGDAAVNWGAGTKTLICDLPASKHTLIASIEIAGYKDFGEVAAPADPAANTLRMWAEDEAGFGVLSFKNSAGLNHQLTRDAIWTVRNNSGGVLSKGDWVYFAGSTGVYPTVAKAKADSSSTMPAMGVVVADIADASFGQIVTAGDVHNIDTSGFVDGDVLYISAATAGLATTTQPTGTNEIQRVGIVVKGASVGAGIIAVNTTLGLVANKLVDHTAVTLTAGTGLTGGGDISANRSFAVTGVLEDFTTLGAASAAEQIIASTAAGVFGYQTISEQQVVGRLTGGSVAGVAIGISDNNMLQVDGTPNSAEYARFTANGLEGRTEAEFKADFNLEIGTDVQAFDADTLKADTADQLTAAFTEAVDDDGTKSSGTYTPSVAAGSNAKKIVNGGAFTLAPPSPSTGEYICLSLFITNNASAGAITTTAFTNVTGDAFTTTNGDDFMCRIEVFDIGATEYSNLDVVALQ